MKEKEDGLSFAGIQQMNKTAYYKLFKKPIVWNKAETMICISKHKFTNGKVPLVCIPYRKKVAALKIYKEEVKKQLSPKFFLVADIKMAKQANGKTALEITPLKGKGNAVINTDVAALFQRMKIDTIVKAATAEDTVQTSSKEDNTPPSNQQNPSSTQQDNATASSKATAFKNQVKQLKPALGKLNQIVGNLKNNAITANDVESANGILNKIQEALKQYEQLPDLTKKSFVDVKKQLDAAEIKVQKVNDAAMFVESNDEEVIQKQQISLEKEMQRILKKYNINTPA